jgi:hypothetical protein
MANKGYDDKKIVVPAATVTAAATQSMSFDTAGAEQAVIEILQGTCSTSSVAYSALSIVESETVTSPTSMESIVALTGGTATSTSAGFVTPTSALMENGGIAQRFQLDLRKRKRYVGTIVVPGQSLVVSQTAALTRLKESADTAALKSGVNLSNTNAAGCNALLTE